MSVQRITGHEPETPKGNLYTIDRSSMLKTGHATMVGLKTRRATMDPKGCYGCLDLTLSELMSQLPHDHLARKEYLDLLYRAQAPCSSGPESTPVACPDCAGTGWIRQYKDEKNWSERRCERCAGKETT